MEDQSVIRVGFGEPFLPGLQTIVFDCPHLALSLRAHVERVSSGLSSFSYKDSLPIG